MPIQSEAMCHRFQVRRSGGTGARSSLMSAGVAASILADEPIVSVVAVLMNVPVQRLSPELAWSARAPVAADNRKARAHRSAAAAPAARAGQSIRIDCSAHVRRPKLLPLAAP